MLELFIIALLVGVGMSHIIVDGSIFAKMRNDIKERYQNSSPWIVTLISCYSCTGFHCGALVGLLFQPIQWDFLNHSWWLFYLPLTILFHFVLTPFMVGCATSYCSMFAAALLNYLDAPVISQMNKKD